MHPVLLAASLALGTLSTDPFQFVFRTGTQTFVAAYSPVRVVRPNGTTAAQGRTDRFGRVTVDLPAGTYVAEITYRSRTWRVQVAIRGSRTLQRVEFS